MAMTKNFDLAYMSKCNIIVLILLVLVSNTAHPYELERAKANMAQDLMFCMSYYIFWAASVERDGKDAKQMRDSAKWAVDLAQIYEPTIKKLDAMGELATNEIVRVDKEEGSARLYLTYGDSCKAMLEHPATRFNYWLGKK